MRLGLLVLAVTGLSGAAAPGSSPLDEARHWLAAGRLFPAEQAARRAVADDPGSAGAHQLLGRILARRRHWEEAEAALLTARELDPELSGLDLDLGRLAFAREDYPAAADWLTRAQARAPDDASVAFELGLARLGTQDFEGAAEAFERAARDPARAQLALYQLGVARARAGDRDQARDAFERAVILDPPSAVAGRAWRQVEVLERSEDERPWHLSAGAGLAYDSNVTRAEIDDVSGEPDGAGLFELGASYDVPTGTWPELELGYDFSQVLYFDATQFDLQSHAFSAGVSERAGPVDLSFSYLYSLNTLAGERYLDFQDLRPGIGFAPTDSWYSTVSPSFQIKRFEGETGRDAESFSLNLLQLLALGGWHRYLLLGFDFALEDAKAAQYDRRDYAPTLALHWPWELGERQIPIDLRYRFRYRDYTHETPSIGEQRWDRIHTVRLRAETPLARRFSLRFEYEFEDSDSNLPSAAYREHVVSTLLRFEM